MTLTATKSDNGDFEIIPSGLHPAILCWVVDLGHQETPWGYKPKVMLTFEFPTHPIQTEDKGEMPRVLSLEVTPSLHEKSNLTRLLTGWFGRAPSDSFDLSALVGNHGLANVVHVTKGERTFANIASVLPADDACKKFTMQNEKILYEVGKGPIPSQLPEWIAVKIMRSREFRGPDERDVNQAPSPADDEDVPF